MVEKQNWLQESEARWFTGRKTNDGDGEITREVEKPRDVVDIQEFADSENVEPANNDQVVQLVEEVNDAIPLSSVPEGSFSAENTDEVSSSTTHAHNNNLGVSTYVLPDRQNRGKPPKRYSPNDEKERQTRYPIANYVSTQRIPKQEFCTSFFPPIVF